MFKPFTTENLLSEWYQEAQVLSSPFAIKTEYSRIKVDFIYKTLEEFFGLRFFGANAGIDKAIDKISWLFSLVSSNKSVLCYNALYDVCLLIDYSKSLDEPLQKEMQQLKANPENLRAFFFELFIFRMLDLYKVPNAKKVISENQVLEGTFELNDTTFLFECRKVFMPKMEELDIKRRLMTDFWQLGQKYQTGTGLICTIKLNRPLAGIHRSDLGNKLRIFFKKLSTFKTQVKVDYTYVGNYGEFKAIDYDEATLIEIKAKKEYDVLYYVIPPKIPAQGMLNRYQAFIGCNFSVAEKDIVKKLETVLKEKKKQHKNSSYQNKVIFLDSESLPEFHMNIFQPGGMHNLEMIRQAYDKAGLKDILCIIRRYYDEQGPEILADVIAPQHLQVAGIILKKMLENYPAILSKSLITQSSIIQL